MLTYSCKKGEYLNVIAVNYIVLGLIRVFFDSDCIVERAKLAKNAESTRTTHEIVQEVVTTISKSSNPIIAPVMIALTEKINVVNNAVNDGFVKCETRLNNFENSLIIQATANQRLNKMTLLLIIPNLLYPKRFMNTNTTSQIKKTYTSNIRR